MVRIPLASKSAEGRSGAASLENLINVYPHPNPEDAPSPFSLVGTPGLIPFGDEQAIGPCRGITKLQGDLYAVIGERLYAYTSSGDAAEIGTIPGADRVYMAGGKFHIIANCGAGLFAANRADGLNLVSPEESWVGVGAAYQDGYGIAGRRGGQQWNISNVEDGTVGNGLMTWGSLDFTSSDSAPDNLVGLISDHREVKIFKEETIENYVNTGDPDFPFRRTGTGLLEKGLAAPDSLAKADNRVYWLGNDLRVYVEAGGQPQPVSTLQIDRRIATLRSPQTASAFVYSQEGHTFYVLNFRDATLVFDVSTGRWAERSSYKTGAAAGTDGRWRAQHHAHQWRKNIVGDYSNGQLYELDLDAFTDDGDQILREWVHPPVYFQGQLVIIDKLWYDLERGVGLVGGEDPQFILDWSGDQGVIFSNRLTRSIGKVGERKKRVEFHRLGAERKRHIRCRVSEAVKIHIVDCNAKIQKLHI